MSTIDASQLLRPGLLQDVSVLLVAAPATSDARASLGIAAGDACEELGARVGRCELDVAELAMGEPTSPQGESKAADESPVQDAVARALADLGRVDLLVVDGASVFARALEPGGEEGRRNHGRSIGAREALRVCLDASWNVTSTVANQAFLVDGHGEHDEHDAHDGDGEHDARGGRIVYIAPPVDAGEHADAARAGLENLARTLSIEWARHAITAVAIAPGGVGPTRSAADIAGEVAALSAYLASPAGAYFSGCLLDLRGPGPQVARP